MVTDFNATKETCAESIDFMQETSQRVYVMGMASEICCQGTDSVCQPFILNPCTDAGNFDGDLLVNGESCNEARLGVDVFTASAETCAEIIGVGVESMPRMFAVADLSACCPNSTVLCSEHAVNPCQNPSNFSKQAAFNAGASCSAAASDMAAFNASAETCAESIMRKSGVGQQRKFAVRDLAAECCAGGSAVCELTAEEEALSITQWVKAGASTCFAKSSKSLSATATGACVGSAMATSYFEQEMDGFNFIAGEDGAYLSNASHVVAVDAVRFAMDMELDNKCCGPAQCGGNCNPRATPTLSGSYAFVQTGMRYGQPESGLPGGWAGIGYYAIKSGSVQTNINDFLIERGDDGNRMSRFACLLYNSTAADSAGDGGVYEMYTAKLSAPSPTTGAMPDVCGAATKFEAGQIKFSIYVEFGGVGFGAVLTDFDAEYISFRTKVTMTKMASVHFNGNAAVTLDSIGTQDVTSMAFVDEADNEITVAFEEKYISGRIINVTGNPTPTKPLAEARVKVKAKKVDNASFFVDYLFTVTDSMRIINATLHSGATNGGQYIVYDPKVSVKDKEPDETASHGARAAAPLFALFLAACVPVARR